MTTSSRLHGDRSAMSARDRATVLWSNRPDPEAPTEQLQGTWLAPSATLDVELPQLLAEMRAEDRLVTHVIYNPLDWWVGRSRLSVAGVNIKLGALPTQARSTIGLVDAQLWRRWDLAVVLPT